MENDLGTILAQLGGGAGAAVVLTGVIRATLGLPPRFAPITAVVAGFVVAVLISLAHGVPTPADYVTGLFAGLSAVGAYETATRTAGV